MNAHILYNIILRSRGNYSFIHKLKDFDKLLDVGCGNNWPQIAKKIKPKIYYFGLDIQDYNNPKNNMADEYLLVEPEEFSDAIKNLKGNFDAVVSSHNLEHTNSPYKTLDSMCKALKEGGSMYLAFPCEDSVNFPSRKVTLNYYDDQTHNNTPVNFDRVIEILKENDLNIIFSRKKYKPFILFLIGLIQEPLSRILNRNLQGTWALYGFESIIWAKKVKSK